MRKHFARTAETRFPGAVELGHCGIDLLLA
jgi:hypothetical protein